MDAKTVAEAVRARIEEDPIDAARFMVPDDPVVGEEDGVTYVAVRYREPFDVARRYEHYVRMSAIESAVHERTGQNVHLVPTLQAARIAA